MESKTSHLSAIMKNKQKMKMPEVPKSITTDSNSSHAVYVRSAHKAFGRKNNKQIVLNELNMTVPRNAIYGLLGSSGCGKTTLLKCIVGRTKLDSGEVWVMGGRPGSKEAGIPGRKVGYMPQETALIGAFTIRETMLYFGWIAGMKTFEIDEKLDFLSTFLLLPPKNSVVKELSGGQQRRVSLSVALIHDPELLILDEPTVGVDPILRANIWEHLFDITKKGNKTIIITTHYIDEMKQADCIGLMRGGFLLAEDTPNEMMKQMGANNLENIYLKLSVAQNRIEGIENSTFKTDSGVSNAKITTNEVPTTSNSKGKDKQNVVPGTTKLPPLIPTQIYEQQKCWDFMKVFKSRHLSALIWKNLLWMWRNKPTMAFTLLLPVVQMTGFILAIGHDPTDIEIAVKNYETTNIMDCPIINGCVPEYLSCRYLKCLEEKRLIMKYFDTEDEAIHYVRKGHSYAALIFPANYSKAFKNRIDKWRLASVSDIDFSIIIIHEDKSNMQISALLWKNFHEAYFTYAEKFLADCSLPTRITEIPIHFNTPIYGASLPNYTDFATPGAILTMSFFLAMALSAYGIIIERKEGSYERVAVQGVNDVEILFSHVTADMIIITIQCILLLTISFPIFKLTNEGSLVTIFFLTVLNSFSGMCYGFLASAICKDEQAAAVVGIGSTVPVMLLCGMIWPIEAMHPILQYVALFLPLLKSTESLRAILHRGWGIKRPVVYVGFLCTIGWIFFFLLLCLLAIKFTKST